MTNTTHRIPTPGPWNVTPNFDSTRGYTLHEQPASAPDGERYANAALMEAAPKLLSRLQWTVEKLEELGKSNEFSLGMCLSLTDCRVAIKEATGEMVLNQEPKKPASKVESIIDKLTEISGEILDLNIPNNKISVAANLVMDAHDRLCGVIDDMDPNHPERHEHQSSTVAQS